MFSGTSVGVWNVSSGRYRGDFGGCPQHVNGVVVTKDAKDLIVGGDDGKILFWDLAAGMKKLEEFEKEVETK